MFFRNFINKKINTKFESRIRRKVPYLRKKDILSKNRILSKYDIGEDIYFDKAPLPCLYYKNEIVLMPKNKTTLFAYWEVREDSFKELKEKYNVYDTVTILLYKNDKLYRKISSLNRVGSYYILNVEANKEYKAKLVFENSRGDIFEIVESTKAISPSGKISNRISNLWAIPYLSNGKIEVNFYTKNNLPDDFVLRQEISDNEIVIGDNDILLKGEYYIIDENGNLVFIGASDKLLGSSENLK